MRPRTFSNVLTCVTAGTIVSASPTVHRHHRHAAHVEKRGPDRVQTIDVPGPTIIAYEMKGQQMTEGDVCKGIEDGLLKFANEDEYSLECSKSNKPIVQTPALAPAQVPTPGHSSTSASKLPSQMVASKVTSSASSHVLPQSTTATHQQASQTQPILSVASPTSPTLTSLQSASQSSSSNVGGNGQGHGVDREFEDNAIDCSLFPSDFGPVPIDWAGLGGWTGIQYVTIEGNSVTHIDTAVPGGKGCTPGAMCSYACPAGYQKSQWPSAQGTTGQSVGGLQCNPNGKLSLTNPGLSKTLCIRGTGAVTVQNKLSTNAAICRTDYPGNSILVHSEVTANGTIKGTENEVVPLDTQPDSTNPLTCPDAEKYFQHDGSPTTAQYYINNQGIAVQQACMWGSDGTDMGNWAPSYLGVGQDVYGKTWLAISTTKENNPTGYKPLNYSVEITGDTSGKCKLQNGKYCAGDDYSDCNDQGCTVELMSGQASYVLSD